MTNKGRRKSPYEKLNKHPGFKCTEEQYEWLIKVYETARAANLAEWIEKVAVEAGQRIVKPPYPKRRLLEEGGPGPRQPRK